MGLSSIGAPDAVRRRLDSGTGTRLPQECDAGLAGCAPPSYRLRPMLALHALAAAVLALPPLHRGCGESPLAVLRAATQAVAGDSVPAAARRWRQRLARDAHDR